jgi:hypothetical protein
MKLTSSAYETIRGAMLNRQQITCTYQGLHREICVHTLGHKAGREKMLGLQFAGESSKGLPPEGAWRCLFIDDISDVAVCDGEWHTQDNHSKPQTCVDDIDLEIFG